MDDMSKWYALGNLLWEQGVAKMFLHCKSLYQQNHQETSNLYLVHHHQPVQINKTALMK